MQMIQRSHYEQLNSIMWDTHNTTITPADAFALYENRWCYVDTQHLDENEKKLIHTLTQQIGNGHFMPMNT